MPTIRLETFIEAPIERTFDLARSIDLHILSTKKTNEEAIAGKTTGLIELNETVTWRAKHLGVIQKLTVRIIELNRPHIFVDTMLKGAFAAMTHTHHFEVSDHGTKVIDDFYYKSPLGIVGQLADYLFLKQYMTSLLRQRNKVLKNIAESEQWKELLPSH